jgi:hypothetical protein
VSERERCQCRRAGGDGDDRNDDDGDEETLLPNARQTQA